MIGMVLVTHRRLAVEWRSAMEHVVGSQRNVATVCIGPDDDIENVVRRWRTVSATAIPAMALCC
jgi:mannose/fructose-specific phosphotransferase system component IIA